jgi:non-specific serine/threonine protein kinase/serine/threonine-protein kinase
VKRDPPNGTTDLSGESERLGALLEKALSLPAEARASFVEEVADGDEEFRRELESLLAAADPGRAMFRELADALDPAEGQARAAASARSLPDAIGPYRILDVLGEGGMGTVYLAEQLQPVRRRVALKIIKLGMDTARVVARFEAERQALAMMDHPSIATVFDAGATELGRPYFVMELVEGEPITDYCDGHRLSNDERIALFIQVCRAVQHAHQKGVIHRDLKPSNILVTSKDGDAIPRVIDFGIAKATGSALTEHTSLTRVGQFVGTPKYMSPEQAEGSGFDVDTRADVYSLGVVFYELLVGDVPFDLDRVAPAALGPLIREKAPVRPSERFSSMEESWDTIAELRRTDPPTLRRELRGDLDWVVMKAIDHDRTRRYATANDLATELERYLADEPLVARPPSATYRVAKFIQRNRASVAWSGVAVILLVSSVVGTSVGLVRARRAERAAAAEALTAQRSLDFMVDLFEVSDPSEARGNSVTAREILNRGADRIQEELSDEPLVQARLLGAIGSVYTKLGLYGSAVTFLEDQVRIRERELGSNHRDVAVALVSLGAAYAETQQVDEMNAVGDRLKAWADGRAGAEPFLVSGRWFAQDDVRETLELVRSLPDQDLRTEALVFGDSPRLFSARLVNVMALEEYRAGNLDEAERLFREAHGIRLEVLGEEHPETVGYASNVAAMLARKGEYEAADSTYRRILEQLEQVYGPEHENVARMWNNLGSLSARQCRLDEAEGRFRRALALWDAALGPEHINTTAMGSLARIYAEWRRWSDAEHYFRRSIRSYAARGDRYRSLVALNQRWIAHVLIEQGRFAEAERLLDEATPIIQEMVEEDEREPAQRLGHLLAALEDQAEIYRRTGRRSEAERVEARRAALDPGGDVPGAGAYDCP